MRTFGTALVATLALGLAPVSVLAQDATTPPAADQQQPAQQQQQAPAADTGTAAASTPAAPAAEAGAGGQGDTANPPPAPGGAPAGTPSPAEGQGDHAATGDQAEGGSSSDDHAASHEPEIKDISFSFEGPFGKFDQMQLQRGLQVYTEVCSACHGMQYVPIRTLADPGGPELPEDQVRAYAASLAQITDADTGEDRPRLPSDHFPPHQLAAAPDLSLMAKARAGFHGPYGLGINQFFKGIGGPEYIHAILTGYTGETKEIAGSTFYGNEAFPGGWIAMPPPLADGQVTFADNSPNDLDHEARDIAAFLTWAAEPKMMARKHAGFVAVLFLALLSVLLYLTNKRIWAPHKGKLRERVES